MEGDLWEMAVKLTDNRKVLKTVYQVKPDTIEILEIPDLNFLVLDGELRREELSLEDHPLTWVTSRIQNQLRLITSKRLQYNFRQMPYEMIWQDKLLTGVWRRTVMVQLPEQVDEAMFQEAIGNVKAKNKKVDFLEPAFQRISQGLCAQKLHFGHYDDTEKTVQEIVKHISEKGYIVRGKTREIYLNPPNWNPVEKWQTIVRVPIMWRED